MKFLALLLSSLLALVAMLPLSAQAAQRGLAWGTNDNWGPNVAKGLIKWYWHWQDGPNSRFNGILEFVPCYWGPKYNSQWAQRKNEMNANPPKALLGFNEPDISGQSNLDPQTAANLWMQEIQPWKKRGVRLGSPQIVWNQDWLASFMSACKSKGCTVGKYLVAKQNSKHAHTRVRKPSISINGAIKLELEPARQGCRRVLLVSHRSWIKI